MFGPAIENRRPRSLRELVRDAVDTALEFATLGEASLPAPATSRTASAVERRPASSAPIHAHPHRRRIVRAARERRPGTGTPRAQVCTSPVNHHPARH